jgi:hypothetical protein
VHTLRCQVLVIMHGSAHAISVCKYITYSHFIDLLRYCSCVYVEPNTMSSNADQCVMRSLQYVVLTLHINCLCTTRYYCAAVPLQVH